jgi:hypothetical protein
MSLAVKTTVAPNVAKPTAVCFPIPDVAPVISTTLSFKASPQTKTASLEISIPHFTRRTLIQTAKTPRLFFHFNVSPVILQLQVPRQSCLLTRNRRLTNSTRVKTKESQLIP